MTVGSDPGAEQGRRSADDHLTHTLPVDAAGVDELGVVPWPILLRRRLAHRTGIDRKWATLIVVLSGVFTVSFTITLLVVSLETIADELDSSVTTLNWAITAPMLAFGVVGPAFGKLGDLYGHKRVFVLGLSGAAVFALATAFAWSAPSLILFRTLSASAGSATGPAAMAYINQLFPPDQRVRPLGYWSFVSAGAPVIGVVAGAPLVEAVGWRVIFLIQAPLSLAGVLVAVWLLPPTARAPRVRFDVAGSVTLGIGVASLLLGISQARTWGWTSPAILALLGVGVVLLVSFVLVERRAEEPLMPLRWARTRNVAFPVASQSLTNFAYMGGFIVVPQLLERGLGMTPSEISWLVIARPLTFSIVAPTAAVLTVRWGERTSGVLGSLGVVVSMLMMSAISDGVADWFIVVALALSGAGLGIASPAMTSLVANAVDDTDLGVAGAMQQLMAQLGAVVGATVMVTVQAATGGSLVEGYQHAFWVGAAVAGSGTVAAAFVRSMSRPR